MKVKMRCNLGTTDWTVFRDHDLTTQFNPPKQDQVMDVSEQLARHLLARGWADEVKE